MVALHNIIRTGWRYTSALICTAAARAFFAARGLPHGLIKASAALTSAIPTSGFAVTSARTPGLTNSCNACPGGQKASSPRAPTDATHLTLWSVFSTPRPHPCY